MQDNQITLARANLYTLFGVLFVYKAIENGENFGFAKEMLGAVLKNPFLDEAIEPAHAILETLNQKSAQEITKNFDKLFSNPFNNQINQSISFYDEGREFGSKLLEIKELIAQTPLRRDESAYSDSEDNFGFVLAISGELLKLCANSNSCLVSNVQKEIFNGLLKPYVNDFTTVIQNHQDRGVYREIAKLLEIFIAFESSYLNSPL